VQKNDHSALISSLIELGLVSVNEVLRFTSLTGGVASDIWLVEAPTKRFAVKRALPKLRVAADWQVPVSSHGYGPWRQSRHRPRRQFLLTILMQGFSR
jgi:hypothetical protein